MILSCSKKIVFILLEQKINLNPMKKFVRINISVESNYYEKKNSVLKFNQHTKLDKMPYAIYADT